MGGCKHISGIQSVFVARPASTFACTRSPVSNPCADVFPCANAHSDMDETKTNDVTVHILRGISGSGKTTLATSLAEKAERAYPRSVRKRKGKTVKGAPTVVICSADDYFMRGGKYAFDRTHLPEAHAACFGEFEVALTDPNVRVIIVDNTNLDAELVFKYIPKRKTRPMKVFVHQIIASSTEDVELCARRNTHDVPHHAVAAQQAKMADIEEAVKAMAAGIGVPIEFVTSPVSRGADGDGPARTSAE